MHAMTMTRQFLWMHAMTMTRLLGEENRVARMKHIEVETLRAKLGTNWIIFTKLLYNLCKKVYLNTYQIWNQKQNEFISKVSVVLISIFSQFFKVSKL